MRGKSLTPVSRMEMDESSSCMLDRRDDTHPSREFAIAFDFEVYARCVGMRGGWRALPCLFSGGCWWCLHPAVAAVVDPRCP